MARSVLLPELAADDWQQATPCHHYSQGEISGALILLLDCRGSLHGSALALGLLSRFLTRGFMLLECLVAYHLPILAIRSAVRQL